MDMEQLTKLPLDGLRVGDRFRTPGDNRIAPQSGVITKISRTNLKYETHYCPAPGVDELMNLQTRRTNLIGAKVIRGNELFEVIDENI
ncbi:MAG: hypothetical protein KGL39_19790 [Patescibacteria group bacterium]|nr:hypothetical protein [Patescibacteria group bacterium]